MKMENSSKYKFQIRISVIIMFIGFVLMVGKIYADSEPGAIPLLLILSGAVWYFIIRFKNRSQHTQK